MNYKLIITNAIFILLTACTQAPEETAKPTDSSIDVQPKQVPEVNDANCRFDYMKSITDKVIQQTLADDCARRSTLKPTEHKPWTLR
jgi:entry exclusion lipoprotein TrbK